MLIKDLSTLKEYFSQIKTPIFGTGVYAFNRLGLEDVYDHYHILALRYSLDTKLIEKDVDVLSLEKGLGTKHINQPRNSTTVLNHPKTKLYLKKFSNPAIVVYKPSEKMEQICQENNWRLLNNPTSFGKNLLENKIKFRRILKDLGVAVPPGKIALTKELHYGHLMNKYGLPFVLQHPSKGGGKGTFFINNKSDFDAAVEKLSQKWDEENEQKVAPPEEVIVAQFIQGPSPSLTVCVTKDGILSTNLQYQILDAPELYSPEKGSGLFCGHDWTASRLSEQVSQEAYGYAEKIGRHFKQLGYRGIFGLDFILDQKKQKLCIVECNPRFLGSYPVINMAQLLNQEPPLFAFHILEFLGRNDYQIEIESINALIRKEKQGAQMILHNLTTKWARNRKRLKAGVYRLSNSKL
ncbi:ATP-grasp domain-containing protein, partial [Patescibacteria group bacterium]|nr:ATP-grasp domain-containing protein [Patescibacteria group bacterium]